MSKYRLDDGRFVDVENSVMHFDEAYDWNGNNHISRATGSQWDRETLHCSPKSQWYIVFSSRRSGSLPTARLVTAEEAAAWLALMDHAIPDSLAEAAEAAEA